MKKLLMLLTMIVLTMNMADAAVKISPANIELNANKNKKDYISGSFDVSGGKDETIRFKVTQEFFEHNAQGHYVTLPDKNQPNSLIGKVKFYPSEFTCQNGIPQKVRFTITDIKSLPSGESRIALFLEDTKTKDLIVRNANGGIGGHIIVKTRVAVPIYVNKGLVAKKGTLDSVAIKKTDDGYACEYKVSSTGNSKIKCSSLVYISQGDKLIDKFSLPVSTVEGGKTLEKVQKLDIQKAAIADGQEYKVKFIMQYQDEHNHEKTLKKEIIYKQNEPAKSKV